MKLRNIIWALVLLFSAGITHLLVQYLGAEPSTDYEPTSALVTTDDVFSKLYENNPHKAKAVFRMATFHDKKLPKDSLKIKFKEKCGKVRSYKLLQKSICFREVPIFDIEEVCIQDSGNATKYCYNATKIIGYENESYECWVENFTIPELYGADYKIEAQIELDKCGNKWGYQIDWIPDLYIKEKDKHYMKDKWAWWNATYQYRMNILSLIHI